MSLGKSILQGMIGAYLMAGVEVNKIDWENNTLYLTLPKYSYEYKNSNTICDAKSYAKRIKETWVEMNIFPKDCTVKYKVKDINWTKEI